MTGKWKAMNRRRPSFRAISLPSRDLVLLYNGPVQRFRAPCLPEDRLQTPAPKSPWPNGPGPLLLLAPMDGYTDPAFRRFIKRVEPRAIVFSEFLSAKNVHAKPSLAERMFRVWPDEAPVVIQLYGKDPEHFAFAARLAQEAGAMGIDINMGCPAKKVVAHQHGSALMKNIDLAVEIVAAVKQALTVPVSVKTRLGWEHDRDLIPFALKLERAGLDAITIHGRTYSQKFSGEARYEPIHALKRALSIPVFGNGDIDGAASARAALGPLDGLMVGRAAVADPWIMREIAAELAGAAPIEAASIPFRDKVDDWKAFAKLAVESGPMELNACRAFRKYLVGIIRTLGLGPEVRTPAVRVETGEQIIEVLDLIAAAERDESLKLAV